MAAVDVGLVYRALGFPPQFFTVMFAIPRVTGYLAHWRESLTDPDVKIARPQQDYRVGSCLVCMDAATLELTQCCSSSVITYCCEVACAAWLRLCVLVRASLCLGLKVYSSACRAVRCQLPSNGVSQAFGENQRIMNKPPLNISLTSNEMTLRNSASHQACHACNLPIFLKQDRADCQSLCILAGQAWTMKSDESGCTAVRSAST